MTRENIGSSRASSRVTYVTLFGMLFLGLALMAALQSDATSASQLPSKADYPTSPNAMCWQMVSSPNPGTHDNNLFGIAAVSANDVWAVGFYDNEGPWQEQTLVEHWDGTAWSVVPSPNQGLGDNFLDSVAVVAPNDVWAVGGYDLVERTLVEHWDGTAWSVVPSPDPVTGENILNGVVAVAPNDVWAVGWSRAYNEGQYRTLAEHWNGTAWSIVSSPNPSPEYNQLNGVAAVAKSGADSIWAVGVQYVGNTGQTLVEHWNGTAWSVVPSPNPSADYNYLTRVAAVAANDVWAVGYYSDVALGGSQTLVEHWDGTAWSVVPSPDRGMSGALSGIAVVAANDVWAVGSAGGTLVEHWNGTAWSLVPSPNPNTGGNYLSGASAVTANDTVSNAAGFNDPQSTQMFQDIPVGSTFFQYIGRLASRGYMSGYSCGGVGEPCGPGNLPYFRPNNKASRGQLTKIVSNAAGFQDSIPTSVQTFTDVPPNSTFWVYVERLLLSRPGVMGGYPCGGANEPCDPQQRPYFRLGNNVTRGQTSKIVANTFFPGCRTPAKQ